MTKGEKESKAGFPGLGLVDGTFMRADGTDRF